MSERKVVRKVRGRPAVDGAGVHLVRVLGPDTMYDFDPFLMLDSFDSRNPDDYIAGFPMHPHRGIETVTYLMSGEIDHEDSLGNKGKIMGGQSQWMTAGSGILHQEMPKPAGRMLGVQLWINLPKKDKMTDPKYFDIKGDMIGEMVTDAADVKVISGEYEGVRGAKPHHIQATYYDVLLKKGSTIKIDTKPSENVFVFLVEGDAVIGGETIPEKTAVLFGKGDHISVASAKDGPSRFIFLSGEPVNESIAWGGPIVMNTDEELRHAFSELQRGTFIKHNASK
ncbi:MAG: pirin family protein [Candidatus Methanoplasma sp.]|jgi:redox-sensitive bicupin YhaK (pirin superfamily)|nr:pirin family protein [Candidatus Methanoplasma sp.]